MKRFFVFAALAAVSLPACQPELNIDGNKPAAPAVFTATTESPATKTALSQNGENYDVLWQNGDQITIVDAAATPHVGVYQTSSTTTQGTFAYASGTAVTTPDYKAWYPETLYNAGTPTLPATQEYTAGNIKNSPMYAESSTENLSFKNICGIIRLNVSTTMPDKKVRKIILSATQGLSGAISNAATLASDGYIAAVSGTAGITLDCGKSGVAIGTEATPFHFAVPANTYTGLKITVITTDGDFQTRALKSDKSIVVERSSIVDVTIPFNSFAATDLSADGTANTYIVSAAGNYKFNATVKGNGGIDPLTGTTATTIDPASIAGVKVLWELGDTYGKNIRYVGSAYDISYADGYVYFSTPDTFGNGDAYVAIYDSSDNILWSWLIWATDAPSTTTYDGLGIMDRNLGANGTGNVTCRGLMYEWGRKDPFPSPYNATYTPNTFVPARMTAFTISNIDAEGMTVAYSIAHPTTYPYGWSQKYWQTESEFTLGMWWNGVKTIYDPCPPGWKVPSKDEMQTVINSGVNLPGNGFLGTCTSDFAYGNPGSLYYWTSTGYDRNCAWGYHGGFTNDHVDDATRSGWSIRPVRDDSVYDIDDYTDLSAGGTANSYIIPAHGNYKFRATVKGNGAASLAGVDKATDGIVTADLVWASFGTATAPATNQMIQKIGYRDGYLYFSTGDPYVEGNAVVAVKDAAGSILWSWHLWFESDNLESLKQTYPGGAVFMDRNLGALSNAFDAAGTADFGLLYQWGRKDPFHNVVIRGTGYVSSSNYATAYMPAVLGQSEQGAGALAPSSYTVAYMAGFPNVAYYGYYTGSSIDNTVWAAGMTDGLWDSGKTIFDPCPPGWKVPRKSDWDATFLSAFTGNIIRSETISSRTYQVGVDTGYGWFPSTGYHLTNAYYYNGSQESRGKGVLEQNSGWHIRIWASDGILLRDYFGSTNGAYDYAGFGTGSVPTVFRTNANSVRCVKE